MPVPDGRAADRQLGQRLRDAVLQPPDAVLDLRGVARELLPQPDRHRVLQVGPADLDDVVERLGLLVERARAGPASAGISRFWIPSSAATWIAVGITSLDDWPMLTASLGWTGVLPPRTPCRAARWRSRRSPRWCSCSSRCRCRSGRRRATNWSSCWPSATAWAAWTIAAPSSAASSPRSMLTWAADFLIRPIARMNARGNRSGLIWKFRSAALASAPRSRRRPGPPSRPSSRVLPGRGQEVLHDRPRLTRSPGRAADRPRARALIPFLLITGPVETDSRCPGTRRTRCTASSDIASSSPRSSCM